MGVRSTSPGTSATSSTFRPGASSRPTSRRSSTLPKSWRKTEDLTRVSQFIDSVESSGGELYHALHDIFDADYEPGPVHLFLARTAPLLRERNQLQVILTDQLR